MEEAEHFGYGVRRAINELEAIFACQWRNGMLPQIRFMPGQHGYRPDAADWGVSAAVSGPTALPTSGITQPPIIGLCLYGVWWKIGHDAQAHFLTNFLAMSDAVDRYHAWLLQERDPNSENLVLCLHPWETGTDNSPAFDSLIEATRGFVTKTGLAVDTFGRADTRHVTGEHRPTDRDYRAYFGLVALFKKHNYDQSAIIAETPFLLQDVLFNTLFVASLRALATLQRILAEKSKANRQELIEKAERNAQSASAVADAIRRKLWHGGDGLFYSFDLRDERLLRTATVSSLLPLMGGIASVEQVGRLLGHIRSTAEFWTESPLPSTAGNSPAFSPLRYWSGPSWPVTNWLVYLGLQEHEPSLAEELRRRTLRMIEEGTDRVRARALATGVMERHSYGEAFTTPSSRQYAHAWLWDSAIVALSWPLVTEKPHLLDAEEKPGFWEYYNPHSGEPLGAHPMTWTASLYLELLADAAQDNG